MNETFTTNAVTTTKAKRASKPKRTDEGKLSDCYVQISKLLEQQTATRHKGKELENRLAKINSKIQEDENKALYRICNELNISVKDIIAFPERIPKDSSFDEIANRALRENETPNIIIFDNDRRSIDRIIVCYPKSRFQAVCICENQP